MLIKSGVTILRRNIFTILAEMAFEDRLIEDIEKIPRMIVPDDSKSFRCCIHKDRAIIGERIKNMLGFISEEYTSKDLRQLARLAIEEPVEDMGFWLKAIKTACDSCPTHKYYITEGCRNCVAHLCQHNCPRDAIQIVNNRAMINEELCVECGKCAVVCPFHAIIELKRPCEYACPVNAIKVSEDKKVHLDEESCILCGKCIVGCPFGAIEEKSQIVQVIQEIKQNTPVYALIAPSIIGQYSVMADFQKINGALEALGFAGVFDVAEGADETVLHETTEFIERSQSDPLMTTSCCPSFKLCLEKIYPDLSDYISDTVSPMVFAARKAKQQYPHAKTVFIGPCLSKKHEATLYDEVDYVLTFEELAAMFVAQKIDVLSVSGKPFESQASDHARLFAQSGGVAQNIQEKLAEKDHDNSRLQPVFINGIDKDGLKTLKAASFGKCDGNFMEGMACTSGCIGGPHILTAPRVTRKLLDKYR